MDVFSVKVERWRECRFPDRDWLERWLVSMRITIGWKHQMLSLWFFRSLLGCFARLPSSLLSLISLISMQLLQLYFVNPLNAFNPHHWPVAILHQIDWLLEPKLKQILVVDSARVKQRVSKKTLLWTKTLEWGLSEILCTRWRWQVVAMHLGAWSHRSFQIFWNGCARWLR